MKKRKQKQKTTEQKTYKSKQGGDGDTGKKKAWTAQNHKNNKQPQMNDTRKTQKTRNQTHTHTAKNYITTNKLTKQQATKSINLKLYNLTNRKIK